MLSVSPWQGCCPQSQSCGFCWIALSAYCVRRTTFGWTPPAARWLRARVIGMRAQDPASRGCTRSHWRHPCKDGQTLLSSLLRDEPGQGCSCQDRCQMHCKATECHFRKPMPQRSISSSNALDSGLERDAGEHGLQFRFVMGNQQWQRQQLTARLQHAQRFQFTTWHGRSIMP